MFLLFLPFCLLFRLCCCVDEVPLSVVRVENPKHAEEYQCAFRDTTAVTNYTWYRQGRNKLPEGVYAEGNKLHFLKSTPDISGLYICQATNQNGVISASLYIAQEESLTRWILKKGK